MTYEPTYTASEVKVLTETATRLGREIGRNEVLTERPKWRKHRAQVGEEIACRIEEMYREDDQHDEFVVGAFAAAKLARNITSQPSQAASDATSGVPGHQEVSEAVRSPQEPGERS